jgi:hypothetical protein
MYEYRKLTPEERQQLVEKRLQRGFRRIRRRIRLKIKNFTCFLLHVMNIAVILNRKRDASKCLIFFSTFLSPMGLTSGRGLCFRIIIMC